MRDIHYCGITTDDVQTEVAKKETTGIPDATFRPESKNQRPIHGTLSVDRPQKQFGGFSRGSVAEKR